MINVHSTRTRPEFLARLRTILELEWGSIDPFEGRHPAVVVPSPLILLDDQNQLVGGLAFSTFAIPDKKEIGVWINAVLVEPEYQGRGFASELIKTAETEVLKLGVEELYAQTEFPQLYQKLGWGIIEIEESEFVMGKTLVI